MDIENIRGFTVGRIHLSRVDSTNDFLRRESSSLFLSFPTCDLFVVTADVQSAGRGQRGSVWQSAVGDNLLVSILLRPLAVKASRSFLLSPVAALAVKKCVAYFGIDALLKWPNDLYFNNAKLAGILLEVDFEGANMSQAIVGIGLNVNQKEFAAMERNPVSMSLIQGTDFCVNKVGRVFVDEFLRLYNLFLQGGDDALLAEYEQLLMGRQTAMLYRDSAGVFEATVHGVESDGRIRLMRGDGQLSYYSFKEVQMVSLGY